MTQRTYLVAGNGMYAVEEFNALGLVAKESYLNSLTPIEVRAQASVLAAAGRRTVKQVLTAWIATGIISSERAVAAMESEDYQ